MVHPAIGDAQLGRGHDPVEPPDRASCVEAGACPGDREALGKVFEAPRPPRPFVEVAHHHRRQFSGTGVEMRQDRIGLTPSHQPRQVEMHPDNPHRCAVGPYVRHNRAARLQRGQMDRFAIGDRRVLPDEQDVAMPPGRLRALAERHGFPRAVIEMMRTQDRRAPPEPPVGLLQRDDIGVYFVEHVEDAVRAADAVGAHALADIVACDLDHFGVRNASAGVPVAP